MKAKKGTSANKIKSYILTSKTNSSTVPKPRLRPKQMSSIAPKFLFHRLVDIVKRFVILKFQETFAHTVKNQHGPTKSQRDRKCGPFVFSPNQILRSEKNMKNHISLKNLP